MLTEGMQRGSSIRLSKAQQRFLSRRLVLGPNLILIALVLALRLSRGAPNPSRQEDIAMPRPTTPPEQKHHRRSQVRTDVQLVLIPVVVTDPFERPVLDLGKQNFRIFDDGVEQKISDFFMEEAPVSVGMVFDASHSMEKKIEESRRALTDFLRVSTPGDEFSLWKFSDHPETVCPLTTDAAEIEGALGSIQAGGWTSLFDALYLALNQMRRATNGDRALFVLSDGGDNNSRYTEGEIRGMVREADVRIFSISVLDHSPVLERISDESGGRAYRVHKLDELPELTEKLSAEIHSHYVLGYRPSRMEKDGKYHKVTVKLVPPAHSPHFRAAWRHGYYAPLR